MKSIYSLLKSPVVLVSALGYFVDIYDLALSGIVRVASLKSLGIPSDQFLSAGSLILNWQMVGMLLGGFAWGLLADRVGRMRALYGSILLYSAANFANALISDLTTYSALRFLAGFGLAGELGAAVTLMSECVPKTLRGLGAAIIGLAGVCGGVFAALLGGVISWRASYLMGGLLGIVLLMVRIRVTESHLFLKADPSAKKGLEPLFTILKSPTRLWKYLRCVWVGVPIWFVAGILLYFSPELSQELQVSRPVLAGNAIMWGYVGCILGDPICGLISQSLKSRKKGILFFLLLSAVLTLFFKPLLYRVSPEIFYLYCFGVGVSNGYWTLFVAMSAEQFGTNVRATVATTAPNLVRGMVIPMLWTLGLLKARMGFLYGTVTIGMICVVLAIIALISLPETFERDLDYQEV